MDHLCHNHHVIGRLYDRVVAVVRGLGNDRRTRRSRGGAIDDTALTKWSQFRVVVGAELLPEGLVLSDTPLTLGRRLELNPNTESFIGDEEAIALVDREYRLPYKIPTYV